MHDEALPVVFLFSLNHNGQVSYDLFVLVIYIGYACYNSSVSFCYTYTTIATFCRELFMTPGFKLIVLNASCIGARFTVEMLYGFMLGLLLKCCMGLCSVYCGNVLSLVWAAYARFLGGFM